MLLVDDILFSPFKSLSYIFKQIHKAAEDEFLNEENITVQLSELYMMLETGKITEEEFDKKESELLNRLEQIEEYKKKRLGIEENEDVAEAITPKKRMKGGKSHKKQKTEDRRQNSE